MGVHNRLSEIPLRHSIVKLEMFDFNVGNYKGSIPLQTYWLFTRLGILENGSNHLEIKYCAYNGKETTRYGKRFCDAI
jgi:hypothetical protein